MKTKNAREIARLNARCDQAEAARGDRLRQLARRYGGRIEAERARFVLDLLGYVKLDNDAQDACDELFEAEHGFHPSERQWADA